MSVLTQMGRILSIPLAGLILGCTQVSASSSQSTLLISAASSLQDVLQSLDPVFEDLNPDITVDYNFASSGSLQKQIEQGAPADLFIAAAPVQMDALETAGLLHPGTRRNLLRNQLVLIVPRSGSGSLSSFADLQDPDIAKISVGEFRSVPAGQYAAELFHCLDLLDTLQPKLVFTNNVRGVLAAVENGHVSAGVVYASDALISDQVQIVATAADGSHSPIVYPIAIVESTRMLEAAERYLDFVTSADTDPIFTSFGFQPLSDPE